MSRQQSPDLALEKLLLLLPLLPTLTLHHLITHIMTLRLLPLLLIQ